jgi:hypothetical protein
MAIFHLHAQVIKRSEGRSSVAAAAYRLGVALKILAPACAMISAARGGVAASAGRLPPTTLRLGHRTRLSCGPMWRPSRSAKTLNFAASSTIALPRELTPAVPRWPVRFVQKEFVDRACVQRLLSITRVETTPFPPDDHDARH